MRSTQILQAALGSYVLFGLELAYDGDDGINGVLLDRGRPVVFFPDLSGQSVSHIKGEAQAYLIEKGVL